MRQFTDSYMVSDINAGEHSVIERDISADAWRSIADTTVDNATGSNTAPSESVDLTAAVLKGKAGVSGGQASYQIPIDLPPGRNGIRPKVSLSYNSQSGNGIAGVGWSLNAGSAISRCGATSRPRWFHPVQSLSMPVPTDSASMVNDLSRLAVTAPVELNTVPRWTASSKWYSQVR